MIFNGNVFLCIHLSIRQWQTRWQRLCQRWWLNCVFVRFRFGQIYDIGKIKCCEKFEPNFSDKICQLTFWFQHFVIQILFSFPWRSPLYQILYLLNNKKLTQIDWLLKSNQKITINNDLYSNLSTMNAAVHDFFNNKILWIVRRCHS